MTRKSLLIATMFPLLTIAAKAQEVPLIPKAELFGSYSYFRFAGIGFQGTNLDKGFDGSAVYNLNRWLGLAGDIGGHWGQYPHDFGGSIGTVNVNATVHTLMTGPRLTYRRSAKMTPFVTLLVGGAQVYRGYAPPPTPAPTPSPTPALVLRPRLR